MVMTDPPQTWHRTNANQAKHEVPLATCIKHQKGDC